MIFNRKRHTYIKDGNEYLSVTTLISKYFKPFEPSVIAKMLSKFPINKARNHGIRYWKKQWKEAQQYGTTVHDDIQKCILEETMGNYPESKLALEWLHNYTRKLGEPDEHPEMIVINDEFKIAGTVDVMIDHNHPENLNNDRYISLVDWKVVKNINKKSRDGTVNSLALEDCNYNKYALQLNMYAWILVGMGYKIHEMKLVQLKADEIKVYDIPRMHYEIALIVEDIENER